MIKRTLYFGNPAYLSLKNEQLIIQLPELAKTDSLSDNFNKETIRSIPIEDIGVVVLDNKQITITQGLIECLLLNNCALITCDSSHLPLGLTLVLSGNTTQSERFRHQIEASLPLKKQLWQQTIQNKIRNQAFVLEEVCKKEAKKLHVWEQEVKSGDSNNIEARAAFYYWKNLFSEIPNFTREREGIPPNNLLNYGYAILRAVIARSLVSSGLLPTLGIHHHNKYNAYCLADDIMEPYRPFVDKLVFEICNSYKDIKDLSKEHKAELLKIPVLDVLINGERSPLMIAASTTTASLYRCFAGETRRISYPSFIK